MLLVIGGYFITKDNNYDLKENGEDRVSFIEDLTGWVVQLFDNTKDIAEEAKEKEWLPNTNVTENE